MPWVAIFWYVTGAPKVPGFVWAITVTQLILFAVFALNMALQYLRAGPWRSYLTGERGYLTLSLIAKSLLAWLIYANVYVPELDHSVWPSCANLCPASTHSA